MQQTPHQSSNEQDELEISPQETLFLTKGQKQFLERLLHNLMVDRAEFALNWGNPVTTEIAAIDAACSARYQIIRDLITKSKVVDVVPY